MKLKRLCWFNYTSAKLCWYYFFNWYSYLCQKSQDIVQYFILEKLFLSVTSHMLGRNQKGRYTYWNNIFMPVFYNFSSVLNNHQNSNQHWNLIALLHHDRKNMPDIFHRVLYTWQNTIIYLPINNKPHYRVVITFYQALAHQGKVVCGVLANHQSMTVWRTR